MGPKGKRDMVSEEIRMFEKGQRTVSVVTQAKQHAWTKWNDIEPIKLSWKLQWNHWRYHSFFDLHMIYYQIRAT